MRSRTLVFAASLAAFGIAVAEANPPHARNATYAVRASALAAGARAAGTPRAVEIAVSGDGVFPARASDPVLHIGSITVRKYKYEGAESRVLVFTVPSGTTLDRNNTNALPPACVPGSANGLRGAKVKDKLAAKGWLEVQIKVGRTSLASQPVAPLAATIVLPDGAGHCARTTLTRRKGNRFVPF